MDSNSLVGWEIDAGQRVLIQLVHDGFPVDAALWIKTGDNVFWSLFIASPVVEQKGPAGAYRDLQASLQHLEAIPVSLSDITLIGREDPITREVANFLARHPGRLATRYGGKQLGNVTIEEAYIYPSSISDSRATGSMAQDQVLQELFRRFSGGPASLPPSRVVLRDGSSFEGVPFSIQSGSHRPVMVQFIAEGEFAPRILSIDEIAWIE